MRQFPLLDRGTIASDPAAFRSTRFTAADCIWQTTSGTSGIPLPIPRDRASNYGLNVDVYRLLAEHIPEWRAAMRTSDLAVIQVGDNPDRVAETLMLPSLEFRQGRQVVLNKGSAEDARVVVELRQLRIPLLYGRPRALLRLAELDRGAGFGSLRPAAVLTSGDNLYPDTRVALQDWFAAPVYDAYGLREAGIVGVECHRHVGLHVFGGRAQVEVLNDEGAVVEEGSGELVVTNMENWAMPIIRYRTGDFAHLHHKACPCGVDGVVISRLSGRDSIYFALGQGGRANPSVLNTLFHSLPIRQFQVTQLANSSLVVSWVPHSRDTNTVSVERRLKAGFEDLLPGLAVECIAMAELAVAPHTKVQRFVRLDANGLVVKPGPSKLLQSPAALES